MQILVLMSQMDHSRRFGGLPVSSGLPRELMNWQNRARTGNFFLARRPSSDPTPIGRNGPNAGFGSIASL
jgi:hypothetical protein